MKRPQFTVAAVALLALWSSLDEPHAQSGVSAPVLMWQYGGCLSGPSCQTGWYSSPAVADLDGDGRPEVIWGAADVVALDGTTGNLKWRGSSSSRIWPGIAVADLTGDGSLEVIAGRNSDQLTVYNRFGSVIWTRNPFGGVGELRTLVVTDLESDGQLEIVVGQAAGVSSRQVNVLTPAGAVRSAWPARHDGERGSGGGLWNADVAVADMNGDGIKEVFAANGSHYINAFDRGSSQLDVNGIFAPRQFWSEVGVAVDHEAELRGWVNCGVEHRPDFSTSAPAIVDVNGDGVPELIVVGSVRNCGTNPYTDLYQMPFVFNLDRTRWNGGGFDWTVIPTPGSGSGPRSTDYQVIENAMPNAVVADLDGDGLKEILFPSYDGKLHAYWLDKTERGNWPYTIPTSGTSGDEFRFAGEPVVADVNNDGRAEVIFTSWPKKASGRVGQLHVLDYLGAELYRISLPVPANGGTWNGAMGAPTITNIDSDADLELVIGTVASGVVAYKLPNTATARVLWGTARGNFGRTGTATATVAPPPPDTTPPTISGFSPTSGGGGTSVTIGGTNFSRTTAVRFNGVSAAFTVTSATSITATVPSGAATGPISVTTPGGTATSTSAFSVATTLAVAITSPANGATVSGPITLTANATGDFIGILFFVDDTARGPEGTTSPHSVAWDTTTVSNGSHRIDVVARDAADTRVSAHVTVTVSNGTAPTVTINQAAGQSDPANSAPILFTAVFSQAVSGFTGSDVAIGGTAGGTMTVTVSGGPSTYTVAVSGMTTDGTVIATIPAGAASDAAGNPNTASTSTDNTVTFRAADTTVTRFEETAATYTGTWSAFSDAGTGVTSSNGIVAGSRVAGSTSTLTFTGTGISWIGFPCEVCGIANVFLAAGTTPGTSPVATLDTFAATRPSTTGALWTSPPLAAGTYTLRIEVTDTKNPSSADFFIIVDAFDVTGVAGAGTSSPDTTPPSVAITSPASGATVSGTISVTATASDDVGVAGVQFFLDGAPLGVEDATAPYSVVWDTTTVVDGAHTLTARARDAAGNTATSAPVTVTVDQTSRPPTATRFESTDRAITYTPGDPASAPPAWFHGSRSRGWSDGTASFNRSAGARATFTFTGTSVSWIGFRAYWAGIANVYLDGALVATVDLFLPRCPEPRPAGCVDEEDEAPVFTATGLASGSHTVTVEVTGTKNPDAVDNAVVVDAFDVAPATPPPTTGTRVEQTPSVTYTAGWTPDDGSKASWSGTTAAVSPTTGGERATFTFRGTEVRWVGLRGPATGIADVSLDGAFHARVDTYAPTEIQGVVFTITGLAPATHTVTIETTGLRNPSATGSAIVVDAFDVRGRFEERDAAVRYTGTWIQQHMDRAWSGTSGNAGSGTAALSATGGTLAELTFSGTAVSWIAFRGPSAGMADVFLDGSFVRTVDLYAASEELRVPVFTVADLPEGSHTLTIRVTGTRNPAATAAFVVVDAFDVELPASAPSVTRVQQTDPAVTYMSGWTPESAPNSLFSGRTIAFSTLDPARPDRVTGGAQATFTFTGTTVRWIGHRSRDAGIALVSIDGTLFGEIDLFAPIQDEFQAAVFSATGLAPGTHTLTIEITDRKHGGDTCTPGQGPDPPPCSAGYLVVIDAFDIYQ